MKLSKERSLSLGAKKPPLKPKFGQDISSASGQI